MAPEPLVLRPDASIRYGQCWEDADMLLQALDIAPGDTCLSIASAGDNTLALLTRNPARVVAVDMDPAQLACLELRVAAYRTLTHGELLELLGSRPSGRREALYGRCRPLLQGATRSFWDARSNVVRAGIASAGRFERYLALFRRFVLPLVHDRDRIRKLLAGRSREAREAFFAERWDTWRWRLLFRIFFSRFLMARLGRDPSFFRFVEGGVSERLLARSRHAFVELEPACNPYLQWILTGRHGSALPCALRPENFEPIRENLDRLSWHCATATDYLEQVEPGTVQACNLSDIFEYLSEDACRTLLERLADAGSPGCRLAYWNLFVPRRRPDALAGRLRPLDELARRLHATDRAFFYSDFVLEEVV